jgi:hypothetical protein
MRSKQRCHGGPPCDRCNQKGFGCVYSTPTESSSKSDNDPQLSPEGQGRPILNHGNLENPIEEGTASAREITPFNNSAFFESSMETILMGLSTNDLDSQGLAATTIPQETGPIGSLIASSTQQVTDFSAIDGMEVDFLYPFSSWPVGLAESVGAVSRASSQGNLSSPPLAVEHDSRRNQEDPESIHPPSSDKGSRETQTKHESRPLHSVISFPALKPSDLQSIAADRFGHLSHIPEGTINAVTHFYLGQENHLDAVVDKTPFPPFELLITFVDLFFEHFNPIIPIIHQATFEPTKRAWILLLGMAAIGSQYSSIDNRAQFGTAFRRLLQRAISDEVSK